MGSNILGPGTDSFDCVRVRYNVCTFVSCNPSTFIFKYTTSTAAASTIREHNARRYLQYSWAKAQRSKKETTPYLSNIWWPSESYPNYCTSRAPRYARFITTVMGCPSCDFYFVQETWLLLRLPFSRFVQGTRSLDARLAA